MLQYSSLFARFIVASVFHFEMKRSFSTKRCLLFWACLVSFTVLFQYAIVILVSICNKESCLLTIGEAETYPTSKLGKYRAYHCKQFSINTYRNRTPHCNFTALLRRQMRRINTTIDQRSKRIRSLRYGKRYRTETARREKK